MTVRTVEHAPSNVLRGDQIYKDRALIILNQPIASLQHLEAVWKSSAFRICADGGANRLHDICRDGNNDHDYRRDYLPDSICGDLDSLNPAVEQYYQSHNVPIERDGDQYSTDFGKCMLRVLSQPFDIKDIVVMGSIGGRVDQGIGLLSEISREQIAHEHVHLWLVTESSLSWILQGSTSKTDLSVKHSISGLKTSNVFTENIGILPIYGPSLLKSTSGLEWDVEDWPTQMSENVSTSNHVKKDEISVEVTSKVLFTIELAI